MLIFSYLARVFDVPILQWIARTLHSAVGDAVMPVITLFGEAGIFWIAAALLLIILPKQRKTGVCMGLALLIGLLLCNLTLKPLIGRIRPYEYLRNLGIPVKLLVKELTDGSFPSGHTLASFEAATVLMIRNKKLGIPALILAILVAVSRLYLMVHYPTDVLVSVALGIGIAYLANFLVEKYYDKAADRLHRKK